MPVRQVMAVNDDLPIRTDKPVHSGKVRAVYWLTAADSKRLIESRKYDVAPDAELAVMVISDRISAYECIWRGEGGLLGVAVEARVLEAQRGEGPHGGTFALCVGQAAEECTWALNTNATAKEVAAALVAIPDAGGLSEVTRARPISDPHHSTFVAFLIRSL